MYYLIQFVKALELLYDNEMPLINCSNILYMSERNLPKLAPLLLCPFFVALKQDQSIQVSIPGSHIKLGIYYIITRSWQMKFSQTNFRCSMEEFANIYVPPVEVRRQIYKENQRMTVMNELSIFQCLQYQLEIHSILPFLITAMTSMATAD